MATSVTVPLPQEALQRLRRGAGAAGKSLEQFVVDRLLEAVPPLPDEVPTSLKTELEAMEHMEDDALREVAESQLPPSQQRTYSRLLGKNADGTISARETEALATLGEEARRLTLKKAHAYRLLKWRGAQMPSRQQLESSR